MHAAGNLSHGVYSYTGDLLALRAAVSPAVILPPECSEITSPLKPDVWESYLSAHPDRQFVEYLMDGIRWGFRVGCYANDGALRSATRNMLAADLHPTVIEDYLSNELSCNRLVEAPSALVHISSLELFQRSTSLESGG